MVIILYYDSKSCKRYQGLFALINNKSKDGYIKLFESIRNILTVEKTKNLNLKTITTDFELGLINALEIVFPGVRKVGCFYHFVRAIKEKFKSLGLLKDMGNKENSNINLVKEI